MGTPVPPPAGSYEPGLDCPTCTPALYLTGEWPLYMYATFFDVTPSPGYPAPPNNYTFKLKQGINPCTYLATVTVSAVTFDLLLDLTLSMLWLYRGTPPSGYYFSSIVAACSLYFPINLTTDPPDAGTGGRGLVRPTPAALPSLLTGPYAFMPWRYPGHSSPPQGPPTFFESKPVAMDHELVRLANKADASCCHFYVDLEDLPAS